MANYTLINHSIQYEHKHYRFFWAGQLAVHDLRQRQFTTMTWEASIPFGEFSGAVNPGQLSQTDGWQLQSCQCTNRYGQPLSQRVTETWVKHGDWVTVENLLPETEE